MDDLHNSNNYLTLKQASERWDVSVRDLLRLHLLGEVQIRIWIDERWAVNQAQRRKLLLGVYWIPYQVFESLLTEGITPLCFGCVVDQQFKCWELETPLSIDVDALIIENSHLYDLNKQMEHDIRQLERQVVALDKADALPDLAVTETPSKTFTTRERNTLLLIIATLSEQLNIDIHKPEAAGVAIQKMAELSGLSISNQTIANKLKLLPDLLEKRRQA